MAIQGLRTTGNWVADQRPKSWREGLLMRYPNGQFPLTALTSVMKSRTVDDPEFYWWEKEFQNRRVALAANLTTGTTNVSVVSGALGYKEGDIFYVNQTGERVRVMADSPSDTVLIVARAQAGTSAQAVTYNGAGIDPYLTCIGSAYEEGSAAPTGVGFDPVKLYNLTQIFRNSLEATNTALKTRLRTGDDAKEAKRECLELHGVDMERAFWWGKRFETVKNGKPLRFMDGVLNFIPAGNVFDGATVNGGNGARFSDLEDWMEQIFRKGSSEKMVFSGNLALLNLQRVIRHAKGIHWTLQDDKEFGMNVTRITSPFGTLVWKTHPLFNQMVGGTTGGTAYLGMNSSGVVLDMENIKYVYLKDRDTKYQPDLQDRGVDGMKSGYLTECSIELNHAETHAWIKNFATYAAEA